jgi:hypothetical protein
LWIVGTRNMLEAGAGPIWLIGHLTFISLFTFAGLSDTTNVSRITCRRAFWAYAAGLVFATYLNHPDLFSQALGSGGDAAWTFIAFCAENLWWGICWMVTDIASWVYAVLSAIGYGIWNTGATIIANWVWSVCAIIGWGILTAIMWQYEGSRIYMVTYYRDIRLRQPRIRIMNEIARRLGQEFENSDDKPYGAPYWTKRIKGSSAAWSILREIVDSDAWVRVKPEQLDLSISRARLDQIADAVWKEYKTERALVKVQNTVGAVGTYLKKTYGAYWLSCAWKATKWIWARVVVVGAKNLMALACIVWEIIKARKQGWCPYLQIDRTAQQEAPRVN